MTELAYESLLGLEIIRLLKNTNLNENACTVRILSGGFNSKCKQ